MSAPELRVVDGKPEGPASESPERCICGRRVTVTVRMRRRSIGVCDRCWDMRIATLKRGNRRAD